MGWCLAQLLSQHSPCCTHCLEAHNFSLHPNPSSSEQQPSESQGYLTSVLTRSLLEGLLLQPARMLISLGAGQPAVFECAGGRGTEEAAAACPCSLPGSPLSLQGQPLSSCGRRKNKVLSPLSPGFPFHSVYWAALLRRGLAKKKKGLRDEHQDGGSTDSSKGKYRC